MGHHDVVEGSASVYADYDAEFERGGEVGAGGEGGQSGAAGGERWEV